MSSQIPLTPEAIAKMDHPQDGTLQIAPDLAYRRLAMVNVIFYGITTNQESAYAIVVQSPELHGPPTYFTPDWQAAQTSVEELAALNSELVVTGHGRALHGPDLRNALHALARDFADIAVPENGRYVREPTRASHGAAYRQPRFFPTSQPEESAAVPAFATCSLRGQAEQGPQLLDQGWQRVLDRRHDGIARLFQSSELAIQ